MRVNPPGGIPVGPCVEDVSDTMGPDLMQPFGEPPSHDGIHEQTHSSLTPESRSVESACELSSSTQDSSIIVVPEDPFEVLERIIENPEVLSVSLLVGLIDNYIKLFGQLKSKLARIDFLRTIMDNPVVLFEIQGLLLKLRKPDVLGFIAHIMLDLEPLLEQVTQVVR